jgi:DNA invertase Pin-like site-specific DNA recombinase
MATGVVRAGIYARQSLNKTGEQLAVERFVEDGYAICKDKGWTPVEVFVDDDTSATNGKPRKDYTRLLQWMAAGKLDAIAVPNYDRLHRDVRQHLDFKDLAVKHGVRLATNSGEIDLATDDGEFMALLFAGLAQKEVRRKGARQRRANLQMATNEGRPWWPSRPFGYDAPRDGVTGKWWTIRRDPATKAVIAVNTIRKHPTEAKLLREAYRNFNAGTTLRTIAARWNEAGITTPRGNRWTGVQVRALLMAARNAGLREYGGEVVGTGTWPAIVSEEVWRQAKRTLDNPARGTDAPRVRKYLLSGIARCGRCDAPLGSAISSRGQRQYACRQCQKISRDAAKLDEVVIETVIDRLSEPDAVKLLMPAIPEADAAELREERRALEDKLEQLGKDFASAPPGFTGPALKDIQEKLAAIDVALKDPGKAEIFEDVIGAKDVRKKFLGLDLGRQRTIVDALMTIRVMPVGKGTGAVFDPDAIDIRRKVDR